MPSHADPSLARAFSTQALCVARIEAARRANYDRASTPACMGG